MKCKACGAEIRWIKTKKGNSMPCDAAKVTICTDKGQVINGHIVHWSTCTAPQLFKKGVNKNAK